MREQVADALTAFAVLLEIPFRSDDASLIAMAAATERFDRDRFAVKRIELRLVIERIDMARPAVAKDEDDALRLGLQLRRLRSHRTDELRRGLSLLGKETVAREHPAQRESAETVAGLPQELAPRSSAELTRAVIRFVHRLTVLLK